MSNKRKYKGLKARLVNRKKSEYDFDQSLANVVNVLLPKPAPTKSKKGDSTARDLQKIQNKFDDRIDALEGNYTKKLALRDKQSKSQVKALSESVQAGDKQNLELSKSLQATIKKLAEQRQGAKQPSQPSQAKPQNAYVKSLEDLASSSIPVPAADTKTAKPPVKEAIKKVFNIGEFINIGENSYKVTNLFGKREGTNAVSGISESEHSRGIDLVGYDSAGKKTNAPISLTDGVVVNITRHGSGAAIKPSEGRYGGYMMDVRMDDGKVMRYMHLGADVMKNKASLMHKKVKRGDMLYEGDYSIGSGSQTAPHIKVRIQSEDSTGKLLKDYEEERNNPTSYALHGRYVE